MIDAVRDDEKKKKDFLNKNWLLFVLHLLTA